MARLPRLVVPGLPMHVVQRGNNKQATFFVEDDYQVYLQAVLEASERYKCDVHAYVLMTNHVHFLLTPHFVDSVSRFMQAIGRRYVSYINSTYKRTGTLWEGRFKSAIVDSDQYLMCCYRYIEMNPVRAGMVKLPDDYKWSSFNVNALGLGNAVEFKLITPHKMFMELGCTLVMCRTAYLSLFESYLNIDELTHIRRGTLKNSVIGNNKFSNEIEKITKRRVIRLSHGGDRKSSGFNKIQSD